MMRPSSAKASSSNLRLVLRWCLGALPSFCKKSASSPIPVKEAWVMQTGKWVLGSRERSQRPGKADLPAPFSPLTTPEWAAEGIVLAGHKGAGSPEFKKLRKKNLVTSALSWFKVLRATSMNQKFPYNLR